jgi:hypothetical protein
MKRLIALLVLFGWAAVAEAVEVAGVQLPATAQVAGEKLQLNGYGIRKKLFVKVYLGSLYTARPVQSAEAALAAPGAKLIRMDFLHSKVDREKIVAAFAEGLGKNAPQVAAGPAARQFLGWFRSDFVGGDRVELHLGAGAVTATHNGRILGSLNDPELARGVLLIYLGQEPADADLKKGMLGSL